MDSNHRRQLYRVDTELEVTCLIEFAAAYGDSQQATLPPGMVVNAYFHDDQTERDSITARAVNAGDWAPFIVDDRYRFSRNYRGYALNIRRPALESHCTAIEQIPEGLPEPVRRHRAIQGCLFGTAVGDAIGLPYEGLTPGRIHRLGALPLRHRFFFGIGMLSDDTEHTCLVAQALIASRGDPDRFMTALAWRLRWWFLGLPAGIGMATLKACLKLWLGFPVSRSGVYSAGNGPGMRSAILGAFAPDDVGHRIQFVTINTLITHTDPKAHKGALIIAELAARCASSAPLETGNAMKVLIPYIEEDEELREYLARAINSAEQGQTAPEFCRQMGFERGVSGYMYHTLPVVLQIVLRHPHDFEAAITEAVACGGDTDTVAAIVGGIIGCGVGTAGIPPDWLEGVRDWPRNRRFIRLSGEELAITSILRRRARLLHLHIIRVWMRNFPFMLWVLAHGFRRLLPPY